MGKKSSKQLKRKNRPDYESVLGDVTSLIEEAKRSASRTLNSIMTVAYWLIGRCIVEFEQSGKPRADYGAGLLQRLSDDLTVRFGRGFSVDNLESMRAFYQAYTLERISETASRISEERGRSGKSEAASRILESAPKVVRQELSQIITPADLAEFFPLSWSHYVLLVKRARSEQARNFYESEALRGGWSVRQLDRQINSQFYERTALSRNKKAMLTKGQKALPEDAVSLEEEIKDPYVLEFLGLKDEYSENELEAALIHHLEGFLLELGGDFCFVGRQKRLRIGDEWYRVDLLFFHRRLKCIVIIDLKIGKFTHADAGQIYPMRYLTYAVLLCLCAEERKGWQQLRGIHWESPSPD